MKILALETTEKSGSVAALEDYKVLYELRLNPQQRTTQSLAPGIREILKHVGWKPKELELIGVPVGPGSFTGLRIGLTTAKILAYITGAALVGLDTLEVIAWQAPEEATIISVAIDAQRGQVVTRQFHREEGWPVPEGPHQLMDIESWLKQLSPGTWVTGPVLGKLQPRIPEQIQVIPSDRWIPLASTVGILAAHQFARSRRDDLWTLLPYYCRPSAAEEKSPPPRD